MNTTNIPAQHIQAHCHQCQRTTATVFKTALAGGIGNCCDECGSCRKGKPYISKHDFNSLMRDRAEGGSNADDKEIV